MTSGVIHQYSPSNSKLIAFEHTHTTTTNVTSTYKLLFIGGMGDGLFSVPYLSHLRSVLPNSWSLIEILTSSSYTGWGMGSLKRDAKELREAVGFVREKLQAQKVVLMGHSTGSQDVMQYLLDLGELEGMEKVGAKLDGVVFQAPVSDREFIETSVPRTSYLTALTFAESFITSSQGDEILPVSMRPLFEDTPITAQRWFDIAAPLHPTTKRPQGADDFFSSDIGDDVLSETWGVVGKLGLPVTVLYSGEDEFVPASVDKKALVERWRKVLVGAGGKIGKSWGLVEGATHALKDVSEETLGRFGDRVNVFLQGVEAGEEESIEDEPEVGEEVGVEKAKLALEEEEKTRPDAETVPAGVAEAEKRPLGKETHRESEEVGNKKAELAFEEEEKTMPDTEEIVETKKAEVAEKEEEKSRP